MTSFTFHTLQQSHFFSITLCKYPSSLDAFNFLLFAPFLIHSPQKHTPFFLLKAHVSNMNSKLSAKNHGSSMETKNFWTTKENGSGFSSSSIRGERTGLQSVNNAVSSVVEEKTEKRNTKRRNTEKDLGFRRNKDRNKKIKFSDTMERKTKTGGDYDVKEDKVAKASKGNKVDSSEVRFRLGLDMCCKKGDVMSAIQLYDSARRGGIKMGQYQYAVLLYLCSSAATGIVKPAKSGSGGRTLNSLTVSSEGSGAKFDNSDNNSREKNVSRKVHSEELDQVSSPRKGNDSENQDGGEIQVSEDVKKYALERGFEIYEQMCMDKVPMNEPTLTAVARMAMSMGNGDMAFDMLKQMKSLGLNPKLRSYGPALSVFCNNGDVDKAFEVEKHMLEHGVYPEEPELEALLRVSVEAGKGDKVYYLLHILRTSVRRVSPSTADIIIRWFKSKAASRVGKTKWDKRVIEEAIENGGGGWHGRGWLGKGKWSISCTSVSDNAVCKSCGEKLATIDLDPKETENFAESVASIAIKRDKDSSFQKYKKWLDYYGPFEAVIDGANVGLISRNRFIPSKINAIVNGIRQKLPSKKWPLIVLHNKRISGPKMNEPVNKALVEKWRNADSLYATPTGSNDDWYWLYAAIKFRCLIVTNDEMRDHTFQLLGNDFFPRWKERHQESANGHWHIPIAMDHDYEPEREWLCIKRAKSVARKDSIITRPEDTQSVDHGRGLASLTKRTRVNKKQETLTHDRHEELQNSPREVYKNLKNILSASGFGDHHTVLSQIKAAEKLGDCVIDFQI